MNEHARRWTTTTAAALGLWALRLSTARADLPAFDPPDDAVRLNSTMVAALAALAAVVVLGGGLIAVVMMLMRSARNRTKDFGPTKTDPDDWAKKPLHDKNDKE